MPAPTRKTASFAKSTALQSFDSLNYYDATLTAASASLSAHTTSLAGNPTLTGDTLTANGTKATLIGGVGNDSLISRSTSSLLLAGNGNETLVASTSGSSTLVGGSGTNLLLSSGANSSLLGGSGTSTLYATGAANTLTAGSGNATLVAGTLAPSLLSAAAKGATTLLVPSSYGLTVGQAITGAGIPAGVVISSIARQTVAGHGDTLTLSSKLTNSIAGGASLSAYGSHDLLVGGSGNSSLVSYAPGNTLKGGFGNATLVAAGSNDSLLGGSGTSSLYATGVADSLTAGSGAATLLATGASNYLSVGSTSNASQSLDASPTSSSSTLVGSLFPLFTGSNTLVSEGANSSVYGGYGNNLLEALGANDTVSVGISGVSAGSNTLIATGSNDLLIGSSAINSLSASGSGDTLIANTLLSSTGSSTLVASGAHSSLYGGSGSSSLYASGASSTLVAGLSNATLVATSAATQASLLGGSGSNSLYTSADSGTLVAGSGSSTLVATGAGDYLIGGSGTNSFLATGLADTLVAGSGNAILLATGAQDSLVGGSGTSSLVASGIADTLVAGSGPSTLMALGGNSETLLGAHASTSATLIGNGHSSLVGQGGTNLYVLTTPGDTISETVNGASVQISGNYTSSQRTFQLQTLVPGAYVTASLTGNSLTGIAHTSSLSPRVGDTLTAIGNYNTLRGGAGPDSLIAQGVSDYLGAGGSSDTLIGSSIAGASETLAGNGQASLVGRGANDLFLLTLSGDTLSAPFSGLRISSSAALNLQTQAPGNYFTASLTGDVTSGIAHTSALGTLSGASVNLSGDTLFTAANAVTLTGGANSDSLIAAGTNDVLNAGAGRDTLLAKGSGSHTLFGSTSSLAADTLIGNGHTSLVGQGAHDLFILTTPGDTLHASISGDSIQASYGVQLDTLDSSHYYTASLTGDYLSASAHRLSIPTLPGTQTLTGDTLFATGSKVTLLGGAGNDSLVALGNGAYLSGGAGNNTLVAASLLGSSSTLVGDGNSSLVAYQGTNAYFQLGLGHDTVAMNTVAGSTAGIVTITTPDSSFYLTGDPTYGSGAHGAGVTLANNLISTGITGVTFVGGTRSGSLVGNATTANSLVAGTVTGGVSPSQTLIGGASSDTLVGNGSSSLYGGSGNDFYILNTPGDKIGEIAGSGNDTIQSSQASFNLSNTGTYGQGILNVEALVSTSTLSGTGTVYTLTGNGLNNTIVGASLAPNLLQTGTGADSMVGGALNDTLLGNGFSTLVGGTGKNLYYVPSQRSYQTNGDGIYTFTGGYTDTVIDTGSGGGIIGQNTGNARFYYDLSQLIQAPGLDSLSYNGSSAATLIGNANSLGDTIVGGLGANSLVGGSAGAASLLGSSANDTLNDGGNSLRASTLTGGSGNDFYIVSNPNDLITEAFGSSGGIDSVLTTLTAYDLSSSLVAGGNGVENLVYTGSGGNVTLGGNQLNNILDARNATAATLVGAGAFTLSPAISSGGYDTLLGASAGTNLFQVLNATDLGSKTSILGGLGTDTLQLLTSSTLGDGAFGSNLSQYVSGVEVLQLASSSVATLGTAAQFAGISTIMGGTGPDTIDLSGYTASATIDAHFDTVTSAGGGDSLRGSTSAGTAFLFGSNPNLLGVISATTLVGQSGQDSLVLNAPFTGSLSAAAGSSGIGLLQLTSKSALTLGSSALSLGISTIVAGTGGDTLNASALTTPITFDATYYNGSSTIGDTLTGSSLQPSTFLFTGVNAGAALTNSSLTGGSNKDSVIVTSATTLGDTAFSAFHSINALVVGGNSSVTLGAQALANGITTLSGLLGNDTFVQTASDNLATTLIGGSGSALFSVATGSQVAADSITGGYGLDTLQLTSAATLGDASLSRLSSVEDLQLTGISAVTLGSLAGHGDLNTVLTGSVSETVDASSYVASLTIDATSDPVSGDLLKGSSLGDAFLFSSTTALGLSTIIGGAGTDTLQLTSPVTFSGALGASISGIEVLQLTSSSAVTLGSANSGLGTIIAGSGPDSINAAAYSASLTIDASADSLNADLLVGSSLGDAFLFSNAVALGSSTVTGGLGSDTLALSSAVTLNDSAFGSHISGIEALSLTSSSAVSLGSDAALAGFRSLFGGSLGDSISQLAGDTLPLTLVGGAGNNFFSVAAASLLGNDSIYGGSGGTLTTNTLSIGSQTTLNDSLGTVTNIQVLELSSLSAVTLGAASAAERLTSVIGGAGGDSIFQTAADTLALYLAGGNISGLFTIANASLLAADTIAGGTALANTLSIASSTSSLGDTVLANVTGVELLQLTSSSSATLGTDAQRAGISTILAGTGPDTINASAFTRSITLDASADASNADLLIGSSSAGSDFLISGGALPISTIVGGSGKDTLQLTTATTLNDSIPGTFSGIEALALTSSSAITLGSNAQNSGIVSVFGGTGGDTITQTSGDNLALTLIGGAGNDSINLATAAQLSADSIVGGVGSDTLAFSAATNLSDASFSRVSSIEELALTGASSVILGANAQNAGFATILGGNGGDTFNQTAANFNDLTLVGGLGNDSFTVTTVAQLTADSIVGGSGTDTLSLNTAPNFTDSSFSRLSSIDDLFIQGGSQIYLGGYAQTAGTTLIAATGAADFIQTTADTLSLSLVGGSGRNTFFLYNTGLFANDTIVGSGGANDLLTINDQANLTDASLANVYGVQTISLVGSSSAILGSNAQSNGIEKLYGFYGGDVFTTNNTATSLFGGGADNFLTSTTTNNWLDGGALASSNVTAFNTNTLVGAAYNTLVGGRTTAPGSSVNNSLVGNGDNDSIIGNLDNTGNDTIAAYGKSSTIIGGGGNDTMVAYMADDFIKLGNGKSASTTLLEFTNALNFTSATITGGVGTNTLQIDQQVTLNDQFYNIASSSFDVLSLAGASEVALYGVAKNAGFTSVYGGNGGDTLSTTYAAYLQGGSGNDLIVGYYGNDTLVGNGGSDSLYASYASGGNNLFEFTTGSQLGSAYAVSGGSTLNNTVLFTQAGTITDTQLAPLNQIQTVSLSGASTITLGLNAQSAGIDLIAANTIAPAITGSITVTQSTGFTNILTVVGGAKTTNMDASSFNTNIILNHSTSTLSGSLLGGTADDTLIAGSGNDTLQGYSGSSTAYTANSTLTGGSGSDLFVLGDSTGPAYLGNIATINNFAAGAGADTLQLHDFGGANAGSDGYQTLSGGGNTIDIFAYFGTEPAYEVAVLHVSSGSFSWSNNASFV